MVEKTVSQLGLDLYKVELPDHLCNGALLLWWYVFMPGAQVAEDKICSTVAGSSPVVCFCLWHCDHIRARQAWYRWIGVIKADNTIKVHKARVGQGIQDIRQPIVAVGLEYPASTVDRLGGVLGAMDGHSGHNRSG